MWYIVSQLCYVKPSQGLNLDIAIAIATEKNFPNINPDPFLKEGEKKNVFRPK